MTLLPSHPSLQRTSQRTEYALNTAEVRMSECLKGGSLSSKFKECKLKVEEKCISYKVDFDFMRAILSCFNKQMYGETFIERENTIKVFCSSETISLHSFLNPIMSNIGKQKVVQLPNELYVIPCRKQVLHTEHTRYVHLHVRRT